MTIMLYDLAGADERLRFSPYCWRTVLALAHKDLAAQTIPWRFTEQAALAAATGASKVPAIIDGDRKVADSWSIAAYLEATYPDRPSLFAGSGGLAHARFINAWADSVVIPGVAKLVVRDVWAVLGPQDQAYFRASREARFGLTLEALAAGRESAVIGFRQSLTPMRMVLGRQPWLGGASPSYADYIVFGCLQWARCVSAFEVLADDDPLVTWREKVLDLFGGLARNALRAQQ
jgi:glutathione S-transferase